MPEAKQTQAESISPASKDALFQAATERMRQAYLLLPDTSEGSDHWELPETARRRIISTGDQIETEPLHQTRFLRSLDAGD